MGKPHSERTEKNLHMVLKKAIKIVTIRYTRCARSHLHGKPAAAPRRQAAPRYRGPQAFRIGESESAEDDGQATQSDSDSPSAGLRVFVKVLNNQDASYFNIPQVIIIIIT